MSMPTETAAVTERLDELIDLFRRRLLDDRDKRRMIDDAEQRARAAEEGAFRQFLHPMVAGLASLVDRLDAYDGPDPAFAYSARDELIDVLGRHGVVSVEAGAVDPARHEVVAVDGAPGPHPQVTRIVRRGFRHGSWVFRPARVVVGAGDGPL